MRLKNYAPQKLCASKIMRLKNLTLYGNIHCTDQSIKRREMVSYC